MRTLLWLEELLLPSRRDKESRSGRKSRRGGRGGSMRRHLLLLEELLLPSIRREHVCERTQDIHC